jgi:hypothetical protein
MTRPRAADDFEVIRSRVKTLQRIYQDNGDSIPAVNPKGARYMTQFGNTIAEQRAGLAAKLCKGPWGLSASYVWQCLLGERPFSPTLADAIADALGLDAADRAELHRAAARDRDRGTATRAERARCVCAR